MVEIFSLTQLTNRPLLAHSMFSDRATQFKIRLAWDVCVNSIGYEMDEYDDGQSEYVVVYDEKDRHLGSLRLRDVNIGCMLTEKFGPLLLRSRPILDRTIEVTRYCLSPSIHGRSSDVNNILFRAAHEYACRKGYTAWVGVFDRRMMYIYKRNKWKPKYTNSLVLHGNKLTLGYWRTADFCVPEEVEYEGEFERTADSKPVKYFA